MSIVIKVKKLRKFAQMPIRTTVGAAAFDLTVEGEPEVVNDGTGLTLIYGSGLAFEFPKRVFALLMARSSCYKKAHSLANGVGLIDSDYRGEVKGVFFTSNPNLRYRDGERFAQLLVQGRGISNPYDIRFQEVDELSDTERGAGGFGSTGNGG